MFLVDSHCHLNFLDYKFDHKNIDDVLKKAKSNYVKYILSVSTDLNNFLDMKYKIEKYKNIFFSCGIHPFNIGMDYDLDKLFFYSSDRKVIALGETGLDYSRKESNILLQQKVFIEHIYLSYKLKKPLIIHSRNSAKDTLNILKNERLYERCGVIHCFSYDSSIVKLFLDIGFYISFSGIVTFNNAEYIREAFNVVPLNRILIETDSPFLSPVPYRGKKNQPAYLLSIAKFLSILKNIDLESFSKITTNNFFNLFNLNIKYY